MLRRHLLSRHRLSKLTSYTAAASAGAAALHRVIDIVGVEPGGSRERRIRCERLQPHAMLLRPLRYASTDLLPLQRARWKAHGQAQHVIWKDLPRKPWVPLQRLLALLLPPCRPLRRGAPCHPAAAAARLCWPRWQPWRAAAVTCSRCWLLLRVLPPPAALLGPPAWLALRRLHRSLPLSAFYPGVVHHWCIRHHQALQPDFNKVLQTPQRLSAERLP